MSFEVTHPYNPARQWIEWGEWYEKAHDPSGYVEAEALMRSVLSGLPWGTVLDVGCGFGRLGELVRDIRPSAGYTGVDVSPHQIEAARRRLPHAALHVADIYAWRPPQTYDLVLTAEVLMHQPPDRISTLMRRIVRWSKGWIVSCDWFDVGHPGNEWNHSHDYPALYGKRLVSTSRVGEQAVFVAKK